MRLDQDDQRADPSTAPPSEGDESKPGRTPPWWPQGEPWPPASGRGHGRGWAKGDWSGSRRHRGPWRPFGCLFLLFGLFAAGTMVVGLWAAAAIVGLVDAPPIVVGAGVIAFIVIALGAFAAARAFRRLSQPLDELIAASGRIEAGDYGTRVEVSGSGEMRSLARAFNQMSERLEASDARRRAFLADVAHELRTPLTVMQGHLEAIGDGVYEADAEHISILLDHTRQMARLVEDLRTISLAEVGALRLEREPLDIASLAAEVIAAFRTSAHEKGVGLSLDGDATAMASVDATAMRRILSNLITNAIRHTPTEGHVGVLVRAATGTDQRPSIEVSDDGTGMSADLVERAFERFEKGPDSDGSGLGLPIARDLVEAQGGEIELRSSVGTGTSVTIRLEAVATAA